jgi:cation diffusion facilitator family transporter
MGIFFSKRSTAWLSIASNTFLTVLKLITGFVTGSVSILSEGAHSAIDLLASIIATFSVYASDKPPDKTHQYGHEKIENVSGVIEGSLIFVAAAWIISESIEKLLHGVELKHLWLGLLLMAISAALNFVVATLLKRSAAANRSVALEADAMHLYTDVYTSLGVFAGLSVITLVKAIWGVSVSWIDPVFAIGVAALIIFTAYKITVKSFLPLIDSSASAEETASINNIMEEFSQRGLDFHNLRTRRAGGSLYADLHMGCRPGISLEQGHSVSHELKARIEERLPGAKVLVHVEPSECIDLLAESDKDIRCIRDELIKDIRVRDIKGLKGIRYRDELRVEAELLLDPGVSLAESSALSLELTERLKTCFPYVKEIILSIRPGDGWQTAIHDDDRERIVNLVGEHQDSLAGIHHLVIASSGNMHRIHLALGVSPSLPVYEANLIARHIEADIKILFPAGADIDIHTEPCKENCVECQVACNTKISVK